MVQSESKSQTENLDILKLNWQYNEDMRKLSEWLIRIIYDANTRDVL